LPTTRRSHCASDIGRSYDLHREAATKGDWLSSGVWGAVFLEGFLEEACHALGIPAPDRSDMGSLVSRLRNVKDLKHGREILDLCDGVRLARNALVHSRATVGDSTQVHAQTIHGYLRQILFLGQAWFADRIAAAPLDPHSGFPAVIGRVFVSTITPHLPRQEGFLQDLLIEMRQLGLEPMRVEFDEYDRRDPIAKVLQVLGGCQALLSVGLTRSHAYFLRDREGSAKESESVHRWYTSGWLNLEAGAAFALKRHVMVMCEKELAQDGIFDRDWNSSPPFVMTMSPPSIDDPQVQSCLRRLQGLMRASPAAG